MTKVDPTSNGVPPFTIKVASFFLLAGLFSYPFTTAVSNTFFALLLLTTIFFHPNILKQGWSICWSEYKQITSAICLYVLISILGYFWSSNTNTALHSIEKGVNWLFVPVIIGLVLSSTNLLKNIFIIISAGLFIHLWVCTLQFIGIISITGDIGGTSATDPAGFIGHLSFGYIYGIWVGLLLTLAASTTSTKFRFIYYILSFYATIFIFLTQGRSGYIITLIILALVFWKMYIPKFSIKALLVSLAVFSLTITLLFTLNEPIKSRILKTSNEISHFLNGDLASTSPRLKIWIITIDIWKDSPWIGIGTGSFKEEFIEKTKSSKYSSFGYQNITFGTPHNEYLFSLLQWGPIGLIIFLYLIISIIAKGLMTWKENPIQGYLISAIGIAIATNAFSATPLSTGITSVATGIVLGLGMSLYKPALKE